jgi:NADPH:quinone reductase-like Zn-dependent oxidoreductase
MQAAVLHARSGAGQLVFKETPMRCLLPTEVRIRVLAAGLPPTELTCNSTQRTGNGHKRLPIILGQDVAGIVDAVGTGVSDWAIDDEVYGLVDFTSDGSAAQYVNARAADIAAKPKSLDFLHAATVPRGALTAWQALFDHGDLHPRQTVLINWRDSMVPRSSPRHRLITSTLCENSAPVSRLITRTLSSKPSRKTFQSFWTR